MESLVVSLLKMNFAAVWSKVWPVLVAILFFGIVIMIHELGHFITAKIFKVKVNEFSLGMGPALLKKKGKVTQYSLRLFPIGGYVSMEGEDEESDDENAFLKKDCWKRIIIVAAGAIMNLLLGFIICIAITLSDKMIVTNVVADFRENSVTQQAGVKPGDEIISINGRSVGNWLDLSYNMMTDKDGKLDMVVKRDKEKILFENIQYPMQKNEDGSSTIIFDMYVLAQKPTFFNVLKGSFNDTVSMAKIVYHSLFDLITGQFTLNDMAGPIGTVGSIANAASESVKDTNYSYIAFIMAMITVNIGVFNLLPLPALDGGRLFFLLVELIRRKPINPKYEGYIHAAGMVLLLIFMAVISTNDVIRLIRGG